MSQPNHDVARAFFAALSTGALPDALLTDDLTIWTSGSGNVAGAARYQLGVAMLGEISGGGLTYTIDSLTAEDDRVVAEVRSAGRLSDGQDFATRYLFLLRVRDGRIASIVEHVDLGPVREKIMPLLAPRLQAATG